MFAIRPNPDNTNVAQTHSHFVDSFNLSSPEDASQYVTDAGTSEEKAYHPDYWRVVAPGDTNIFEGVLSAGRLEISVPGTSGVNAAELQSINDPGLNFFTSPIQLNITAIVFDLLTSAPAGRHKLAFTISSTRENHWATPSAVKLYLKESEEVSLSFKTNQAEENPENVTNPVVFNGNGDLSGDFSAAADYALLKLDRTSYHLEVGNAGGDVQQFVGEHGLNPTDWGKNFFLSIEGLYNSFTIDEPAVTSSYAVGNLEHENLVALDLFQNGSVTSSGYQFKQYIVDESDTDTASTAADGLVLTADGTGTTRNAHVISRVDALYNVFASLTRASADLTYTGTAATDKQVFKYFLVSEQKTATAAQDAIEVHIGDDGLWAIYEKLSAPGVDPSTLTAVASGDIAALPTSFSFDTDVDNYRLIINGTSVSNGTHDFRSSGDASVSAHEFKFGVTGSIEPGHAAYGFNAERDENTANTAVVTVKNFKIERNSTDFAFYAPSTFGPIGDGASLLVPKLPRAQSKAQFGYIDVTKAPFYADSTGVLDSTGPLNHAIAFGRDHQQVVFFPSGTYSVTDTLFADQKRRLRSQGSEEAIVRNGSIRLQGSYIGQRPKIVLAANSDGFDVTSAAGQKPVIEIYAQSNSASSEYNGNDGMENIFSNIDVKVMAGNAGAIGIRNQGAQGTELRDVCVDLSISGFACISGGVGSGGSITNVHALGGSVGFDYDDALRPVRTTGSRNAGGAQPVPTMRGCLMEGQTNYAVKYQAGGPLVMVGCEIRVPSTNSKYTAIFNESLPGGFTSLKGQIACIDTRIEFENFNANNKAFAVGSSTTLKNVYVNLAANVISWRSGSVEDDGSTPTALAGNTSGWIWVKEYAQGIKSPPYTGYWGANQYRYTNVVDGTRSFTPVSDTTTTSVVVPDDLMTKRLPTFPHFEMEGVLNVKDYGAVGDGYTDDSAAIAAAIVAAEATTEKALWIPKGDYVVRQAFDITGDLKIFGSHVGYSRLIVRESVTGVFDSDASPTPILRTADSATAAPFIADLTLWAPIHYEGAFCLHNRSGLAQVYGVSIEDRSDYGFGSPPGEPSYARRAVALILYDGNGGGVLNTPNQGSHEAHLADSRHFLFNGLTNDLEITQLNAEHGKMDAQVEFRNCTGHTEVFGMKAEAPYCAIWFSNGCENFELFGFGGNVTGVPPASWTKVAWELIDVGRSGPTNEVPTDIDYSLSPTPIRIDSDCDNYRITNVGMSGEKSPSTYSNVFVIGFDVALWNFVNIGGSLTPALDWPVLIKKGTPPA